MTDKTLKILLGIIAINLTIQTVKDVGLFPTAYAQDRILQVEICGFDYESTSLALRHRFGSLDCAKVEGGELQIND
jgi:hypothetical protein